MNEIIAAIVGACFSMALMTISNISNRKQRDTREIFARLNRLEQQVAVLINSKDAWTKNL
jgi:hypothetical protein